MFPPIRAVRLSPARDDSGVVFSKSPGDPALDPHISFSPGQTIAQAVYLSGLFRPPVLCSGLARCGRCRMRLEDVIPDPLPIERDFFSKDELEQGWRLGCRHQALANMRVVLPENTVPFDSAFGDQGRKGLACGLAATGRESAGRKYMLAVDLGTTTLQWRLVDAGEDQGAGTGEPLAGCLWEGSAVNPQMGAGSDVMSRLAVAMTEEGGKRMSGLVQAGLKVLVENAHGVISGGTGPGVAALCLAGNPAMTCLSLGKDTRTLARAPYSLSYTGGNWEKLPGLPPVWVPPQLSPFVGGDISAGYADLVMNPERPKALFPFLLADLGTNGEFLLALSPEKALTASVALGPALEGTGLSQGTEARPGAVTAFYLSPKGIGARQLPGLLQKPEDPPVCPGITGTGYISLLSILIRAGVLGRDGAFQPGHRGPFERFFRFSPESGSEALSLDLPLGLRLPAGDVEELLKVKAAFSLGLQRLLSTAGLPSGQLARIYVAGALGLHVDKSALEELGFFPQGMGGRLETVGNSSLAGAALLLQYPDLREALSDWAEKVESLELAGDEKFLQEFPEHMRFAWKRG